MTMFCHRVQRQNEHELVYHGHHVFLFFLEIMILDKDIVHFLHGRFIGRPVGAMLRQGRSTAENPKVQA